MGYETNFEPFEREGDATAYPALARAFAWLNETRSRTLCLPPRALETPVGSVLTVQGINRASIKCEGATRLVNARLIISGAYDCDFERLNFFATEPIAGAAITIETAAGQPVGQNRFHAPRVEGPYTRAL